MDYIPKRARLEGDSPAEAKTETKPTNTLLNSGLSATVPAVAAAKAQSSDERKIQAEESAESLIALVVDPAQALTASNATETITDGVTEILEVYRQQIDKLEVQLAESRDANAKQAKELTDLYAESNERSAKAATQQVYEDDLFALNAQQIKLEEAISFQLTESAALKDELAQQALVLTEIEKVNELQASLINQFGERNKQIADKLDSKVELQDKLRDLIVDNAKLKSIVQFHQDYEESLREQRPAVPVQERPTFREERPWAQDEATTSVIIPKIVPQAAVSAQSADLGLSYADIQQVAEATAAGKPTFLKKHKRIAIAFAIVLVLALAGLLTFFAQRYWLPAAEYRNISAMARPNDTSYGFDTPLNQFRYDFPYLTGVNSDFLGWVFVPDTPIDYPFVAGVDNDKYLTMFYDKSYSAPGTVFLDNRNNVDLLDLHNSLYGHNMLDGTMFAVVSKFTNPDYFAAHWRIVISTPLKNYDLRPLMVVKGGETESKLITPNFPTKESRQDFYDFLYEKAIYVRPDVTPEYLYTIHRTYSLITCSEPDNYNRLLLVAEVVDEAYPQ